MMSTMTHLESDRVIPHLPFGRLHVQHLATGDERDVVVTAIDSNGSIIAERRASTRRDADAAHSIESELSDELRRSLEASRN
ncbi:MAG: hypothetical protein ACF8PN_10425 [Phycisphaerales bacterium]